jgi:hypothetical protein
MSAAALVATVKTLTAKLLFPGVDRIGPSFSSATQRRFAHGQTGMNNPGKPEAGGEEGIDDNPPARVAQENCERRTEDGKTIKHD